MNKIETFLNTLMKEGQWAFDGYTLTCFSSELILILSKKDASSSFLFLDVCMVGDTQYTSDTKLEVDIPSYLLFDLVHEYANPKDDKSGFFNHIVKIEMPWKIDEIYDLIQSKLILSPDLIKFMARKTSLESNLSDNKTEITKKKKI